jgi:hypothetical protein
MSDKEEAINLSKKKLRTKLDTRKEFNRKKKEWKSKNSEKEALRLIEAKKRMDQEKLERELQLKVDKKLNKGNCKNQQRDWTISIALPASILDNAQSSELRTYLAGQIARAAVIFNVDEIVIYDEYACSDPHDPNRRCINQMARILEYLECPQYLRKNLFPIQESLRLAGLLNPLDSKHHLKTHQLDIPYREGVVQKTNSKGSLVFIGLNTLVQIQQDLQSGVRVTVKVDPRDFHTRTKIIRGKTVSPSEPRTKLGLYWGYSVRIANSLSEVINSGTFEYDLKLGTSERGDDVEEVKPHLKTKFTHCLIVFGGLKGIEAALDADPKLSGVDDARKLFDFYLNTCVNQGSNTIRTEEAILISMATLRPVLSQNKN